MNKIGLFFPLCLIVLCLTGTVFTATEFVIIVTSYNNERYVKRNFDSIVCQRSTVPFQIIAVDDCSTDRTGQFMDDYKREHNCTDSFLTIIHNNKRSGSALENIYNTVHTMIPDNKVVVCIDGDDTISFSGVLERLEKEYKDPDVWMTYGRFIVYPAGEFWSNCWGYPEEVIRTRSFRKHPNVPSHLKTFRAALFKKIKKEDLLDEHGEFYKKAWDMAMLYPMLEISAPKDETGKNHSRFIADTVLYVYNFENPIGDFRNTGGREEQIQLHRQINKKQPYEPLDHL